MNNTYQEFIQIGNNLAKHQAHFGLSINSIATLIAILIFFIFLSFWLLAPKSRFNSITFTIAFTSLLVWLAIFIFLQKNKLVIYCSIIIGLLLIIMIFLIVSLSWLLFLWNAYFVWKYESHTLPNLLTLIIGIVIIIISLILRLRVFDHFPLWVNILISYVNLVFLYLLLTMYNFLINLLLYQFVPRHYNQDYLIVLGAGLINGKKVSNLLKSRIDRAIKFATKQHNKGKKIPKLIMSGGQGSDEEISEAQAMRDYAISRGISSNQILIENKSTNTYQNMMFSKKVASADSGNSKFKSTFFTNNYHLFRAAQFSKKANLKGNGVGAHTRLYFLPNAILREFAAYFIMHKKQHLFILGFLGIVFLIPAIITFINTLH